MDSDDDDDMGVPPFQFNPTAFALGHYVDFPSRQSIPGVEDLEFASDHIEQVLAEALCYLRRHEALVQDDQRRARVLTNDDCMMRILILKNPAVAWCGMRKGRVATRAIAIDDGPCRELGFELEELIGTFVGPVRPDNYFAAEDEAVHILDDFLFDINGLPAVVVYADGINIRVARAMRLGDTLPVYTVEGDPRGRGLAVTGWRGGNAGGAYNRQHSNVNDYGMGTLRSGGQVQVRSHAPGTRARVRRVARWQFPTVDRQVGMPAALEGLGTRINGRSIFRENVAARRAPSPERFGSQAGFPRDDVNDTRIGGRSIFDEPESTPAPWFAALSSSGVTRRSVCRSIPGVSIFDEPAPAPAPEPAASSCSTVTRRSICRSMKTEGCENACEGRPVDVDIEDLLRSHEKARPEFGIETTELDVTDPSSSGRIILGQLGDDEALFRVPGMPVVFDAEYPAEKSIHQFSIHTVEVEVTDGGSEGIMSPRDDAVLLRPEFVATEALELRRVERKRERDLRMRRERGLKRGLRFRRGSAASAGSA